MSGRALARALRRQLRLSMRTPEEQAQFMREAVATAPGINKMRYSFRVPTAGGDDTLDVDLANNSWSNPSSPAPVSFSFRSMWSDYNKTQGEIDKLYKELGDGRIGQEDFREALQKLRAQLDDPQSIRPFNPRNDIGPDEAMRIMRRVGAIIKADAEAFGRPWYSWEPTSDSRRSLYQFMARQLPGYRSRGNQLVRNAAEAAPPTRVTPGNVGSDPESLPILGVAGGVGLADALRRRLMSEQEA